MRESRTSGFVRGAHSNMCPYRDPDLPAKPLKRVMTLTNGPIRCVIIQKPTDLAGVDWVNSLMAVPGGYS
jgi:hypothetical protein